MRWMFAIVLIGFALVMLASSEVTKPTRPGEGPVAIRAEPLVLDSADPARTQVGALQYLGGWHLQGRPGLFGGLSALTIRPDGQIWAISDSGVMFTIPQPAARVIGYATVLRYKKPPKHWMPRPTDSESLTTDPDFHHIWVGYEVLQRICRYTTDLMHLGQCKDWPEVKNWPEAESLESMVRLPDGRFIVISEGAETANRGNEALLFAGDPVEPATPHPVRMTYVPPVGYKATDAIWIDPDRLLVLNRRATLHQGFTAVIALVDISDMKEGAVLKGHEIARLAPPLLADNFEGMALERRDGQRILWLLSDNNYLFFQRTLLLKFALSDHF